jgi:hypothetical protein
VLLEIHTLMQDADNINAVCRYAIFSVSGTHLIAGATTFRIGCEIFDALP